MAAENSRSKKGCLIAFIIWIILAVILALVWRFAIQPLLDENLTSDTSQAGEFQHELQIALDGFSGYAVWRSPELANDLAQDGIRLRALDDQANYARRISALEKGDVQFAVFTIDAWLSAGAEHGSFPGSIIMVNDETIGADAMVAYEASTPDITALNDSDARIIATPDSPSEFLSRVVISHFHLPELGDKWLSSADGAEDVFNQLQKADPKQKQAFVLWEPYVAKAQSIPGVKVLVDSSSLSGYIIDVLVVQRAFLRAEPELTKRVIEGYLRAAYQNNQRGMDRLISEDAKRLGAPLETNQVEAVLRGISWANTIDNFTYFGLAKNENQSARHIRESISAISDVLVSTGRLDTDPTEGQPERLYYDQILRQLQDTNFHPATSPGSQNILTGPVALNQEEGRKTANLSALSEQQWEQLRPLGQLKAKPVEFGRGGSRLTIQAQRDLAALKEKLTGWPRSYCHIVGHTRAEGDPEANLALAQQRADAVQQFLIKSGIPAKRLKASATLDGSAQEVRFILGEAPY